MRCGCGGQQRFGIAIVAKGDGRVTLGFIVVSGQNRPLGSNTYPYLFEGEGLITPAS